MQVFKSIEELRKWRRRESGKIGFFPTMGALHEGHAQGMRYLRPRCQSLVISIYVNPTQFGPNEDLTKYPRTLDADLELARRVGVDTVFLPTDQLMYPDGYSTFVEETTLSRGLCGHFRPGHFRGVTTVVLKLFSLVQPHLAAFGLKDAQQFFVIKKMAEDLNLDIEILGVQTHREADGLAMSSRNRYLSPQARTKAPLFNQVLNQTVAQLQGGVGTSSVLSEARGQLGLSGFEVQYLELVKLPRLETESCEFLSADLPYLLAGAVFLEDTRLIDNVIIRPGLLGLSD